MGKTTRRKFTPEFKAKVALETLKESSTKDDLAKKYEISPEMISRWKKELVDEQYNKCAAMGGGADGGLSQKRRTSCREETCEASDGSEGAEGRISPQESKQGRLDQVSV